MVSLSDLQNLINSRRQVVGGDFVLPNDQDSDKAIFQAIHDLLASSGGGSGITVSSPVTYFGDDANTHRIAVPFKPVFVQFRTLRVDRRYSSLVWIFDDHIVFTGSSWEALSVYLSGTLDVGYTTGISYGANFNSLGEEYELTCFK